MSIKEIIKAYFDLKQKDEYIKELQFKLFEQIVKKSNKHKVIYNSNGESKCFVNGNNTIYIQGTPSNLDGFTVDEIIVVGEIEDEEYFKKAILPMGFINNVKIKNGGNKDV